MKAAANISSLNHSDPGHLTRQTIICLLLILMVGIVLRVLCFSGFYGSDDGAYAELAYLMATGQFDRSANKGDPVFPLRLGLLAPTVLGFKLGGPNEKVMIAYPFILSLLSIILIFFAGRAFFNTQVGLVSAAILAILPIDIKMASRLLPDLPVSFWGALGVLCLYLGSNRHGSRSKFFLGSLCGLCFGLSWMCKETILYLFPFVAAYLFWLIRRQKNNFNLLWGTGLSLGGFWIVESLIYFRLTQDFLFRLHETTRNFNASKDWFFSEGSKFGWAEGRYWPALLKRLLIEGPQKIFFNTNFAMVTCSAAIACIYGLFKKSRVFGILAFWFLSLAFMFNFASTSLHVYAPLVLRTRYMYPLLFPAIICVAGGLNLLKPKLRPIIVTFFILMIGTFSIHKIHGMILKNQGSPVARRVSRLLTPQDPIFTDSRTAWVLSFFWRYPTQTQTSDFAEMRAEDIPENAYVLINPARLTFMHHNYGYKIPNFTERIPKGWKLKWQYDQARLYWKSKEISQNPEQKY